MKESPTGAREVGPWQGRGLCLAAAVLWSTSGLFIKPLAVSPREGGAGWSGWQVAGLRALFAGVFLMVVGRPRRPWPSRAEFFIAMLTWPMLLSYILAQTYTTTANAIFLQYTAPVWIFLLAPVFLGERPRRADLAALPPLFAGMLLIFLSSLPAMPIELPYRRLGDLCGLVSGLGYAAVIMAMRRWRFGGGILGLAWGNLMLAAVALPVAALLPGGLVMPDRLSLPQIAYLGIAQIGLGYLLFQWSLRGIGAAEASILSLVEPVLCPLWAWMMIGDRPGRLGVVGGAVVLLTVALHALASGRRDAARRTPAGAAGG